MRRNPKYLPLRLVECGNANTGGIMEKPNLFHACIDCLAFCLFGSALAWPQVVDPGLLSLVPPGASIVAGKAQGREASYLVLTPNNATDLTDFQSISGVDPTREIWRTVMVAASGREGFLSEHSLVAIGHFDSRHIFKSAEENGATESKHLGVTVLIVPPLERDKGISDDLRWLAFIDSQIAVFGTIPMVKEELSRYRAHSPVDLSLMQRLSPLRSTDQSWCVINSAVYRIESVRRTLAALDPNLGQPDHANDGLILGFHFGRHVEIEYEAIPDSGSSEENQPQTQSGFPQEPPSEAPPPASYFFSSNHAILPRVIRFSHRQYDAFVAQEETRKLCQRRTGVECRQESK
jgi:hypothetical protein